MLPHRSPLPTGEREEGEGDGVNNPRKRRWLYQFPNPFQTDLHDKGGNDNE